LAQAVQPPTAARPRPAGGFTRDDKIVLGLIAVTIVLLNIPYGQYPLYPFKLFTTWIHESFHGLFALVTGKSVESLQIFQDTSGVTHYVGVRGAGDAVVASAGYMGTAITGALLLALRYRKAAQRAALGILALCMVLTLVFWVRNAFGAVVVALLAGAFGLLALRATDRWASMATSFLAAQACINAVLDIRVLYSVSGRSDAVQMSEIVGLWPWFWATLWLVLSGLLFWVAWTRPARHARV
jgi:hypothetical protein